jgi:hypothetical protein
MYKVKCTAVPRLVVPLAAALLAVGCRDSVTPERPGPGAQNFSHNGTTHAAIAGVGGIGDGKATPGGGVNGQVFDFDVTAAPDGRLFFRAFDIVRSDGSVPSMTVDPTDPATAITSFSQAGTCVTFGGTFRVSDTRELFAFTIKACDNGSPGADTDTFTITVPDGMGTGAPFVRSGTLHGGDITLSNGDNGDNGDNGSNGDNGHAPPTATRVTGLGAFGDGTATPNGGRNRQEFDFDATAAPDGRLFFRDLSFVRTDGSVPNVTVDHTTDPATAITSFSQTSATCVTFGGTLRVSDTRELFAFTVEACDKASPGAGSDTFTLTLPEGRGPGVPDVRGGTLSEGDIVIAAITS